MPGTPLLLGIDVGTSHVKAMVLDRDGSVRALAARPTPFVEVAGGGVDMEVDGLRRVVGEVVAALGPDRERVAAVGIAGLAESGAPLRDGRPVAPIPAWFDGRGEETALRLQGGHPDLALRIGQPLRSVSSVAKLGWLLDHGVELPDRWLGVPELVLWMLTGAEATEWSLAARTGAFDVVHREWMPAVLAEVGLDAEVFPPVRSAGEAMGAVPAAAAREFGLPRGVPVTVAGHDHLAAAEPMVGTEAEPGALANSVGTAETVLRCLTRCPDVACALELRLAVTLRPGGRGWAVIASAARAGQRLQAVAGELGHEPADLDAMAGPAGERWRAELRALAEGTADAARRLVELTGPAARMVVFGGGSRSRPWLEAKARLLAPTSVVPSPIADATARGAALAAGVAAGWWSDPASAPEPKVPSA